MLHSIQNQVQLELKQAGSAQAKYNIWLLLGAIIIAVMLWYRPGIEGEGLSFQVNSLWNIPLFETDWYYAIILWLTFIPAFFFSFLPKIRLHRHWKSVFLALFLVAVPFIAWDVYFTKIGVWGFNESYCGELKFWGLPLEEILFFIAIPYACIFLYEAIQAYFGGDPLEPLDGLITTVLSAGFLALTVLNFDQLYTATTFALGALFTWYHYVTFENTFRTRWYRAFFVSILPFLLINGMLTGFFTEQPVVVYNMSENLGVRFLTIPVDDFGYSYLMLFSTFTLYVFLRDRWFEC